MEQCRSFQFGINHAMIDDRNVYVCTFTTIILPVIRASKMCVWDCMHACMHTITVTLTPGQTGDKPKSESHSTGCPGGNLATAITLRQHKTSESPRSFRLPQRAPRTCSRSLACFFPPFREAGWFDLQLIPSCLPHIIHDCVHRQ